jgi:hypothetical protein
LHWRATPTKWTIRLELTPDGNPITYDIGTITRPIADLSPEQIGLTLEEGQQLLRRCRFMSLESRRTRMPCADDLARIVADPSALRISAPSVFKKYSVLSDFVVGGTVLAAAENNLTIFIKNFRLGRSFRDGRHRRCAICSPSLALGCRIGRRPACLRPAASAICVQVTWRSGATRSLSAANSKPNDLTQPADKPSERLTLLNPW